ncbi:MAG: NfeD family protein [Rhodothermales bacterium]
MEILIPIALILLGVGFILFEVYLIPGFNVVGIIGLLIIVFGVGYGFNETGLVGGTVFLIGALGAVAGAFLWLWKSGAWDRFILATNLRRDDNLIARESEDRARYLGEIGTAITPLRPTGIVEIEGRRIEVMTEGEFIAAGSDVRVVAMDRRRYFVRLDDADPENTSANTSSEAGIS